MLICAFRAPRIWTGRTEVSSGGTESPAKNLPSFFKSRHLHCNVRTFFFFFFFKQWLKTTSSPYKFIFESCRCAQHLVLFVRKSARCRFSALSHMNMKIHYYYYSSEALDFFFSGSNSHSVSINLKSNNKLTHPYSILGRPAVSFIPDIPEGRWCGRSAVVRSQVIDPAAGSALEERGVRGLPS